MNFTTFSLISNGRYKIWFTKSKSLKFSYPEGEKNVILIKGFIFFSSGLINLINV